MGGFRFISASLETRSKKTTLAAWLLRTAWFAVQREQRALARPKTPLGSELMARALLTKYILRLSPKLADPIVLVFICQNSIRLSLSLADERSHLAARAKKGFTRIEKLLRHTGVTEAPIAVLNPSPFHSLPIFTTNSARTCRQCYPQNLCDPLCSRTPCDPGVGSGSGGFGVGCSIPLLG